MPHPHRMISFIASALLALPLAAASPVPPAPSLQEEQRDTPSAEEIETAVAALRAAFEQRDLDLQLAALNDHRVPAPEVIDYQSRALRSKEPRLKQAALEALRFTDHEAALELLHRECRRNRDLRTDKELGPLLFKAIGQHASASSIELLRDKLYAEPEREIVRARLFGLANIRDREALETLMELLRGAKPADVRKYARELRVCLIQLTSVDRGESADRWREWWSDNKREFELPEEPPLMPLELQRAWDSFWGIQRIMPRDERREDRGGD